jgi:hypothetical protein
LFTSIRDTYEETALKTSFVPSLTLPLSGFIRDDSRSSAVSAFYCRILRRKPIADPYTQSKTDII